MQASTPTNRLFAVKKKEEKKQKKSDQAQLKRTRGKQERRDDQKWKPTHNGHTNQHLLVATQQGAHPTYLEGRNHIGLLRMTLLYEHES